MPTGLKLGLDDFLEDDFELFAIYTTLEIYRIAYFLNKTFALNLTYKQNLDSFNLFEYKSTKHLETWSLVSNIGERNAINNKDTLIFDAAPISIRTYLIPEYKKADCFLKIENFNFNQNIITNLSKIQHVITAFEINTTQLKSKNNLIFY